MNRSKSRSHRNHNLWIRQNPDINEILISGFKTIDWLILNFMAQIQGTEEKFECSHHQKFAKQLHSSLRLMGRLCASAQVGRRVQTCQAAKRLLPPIATAATRTRRTSLYWTVRELCRSSSPSRPSVQCWRCASLQSMTLSRRGCSNRHVS